MGKIRIGVRLGSGGAEASANIHPVAENAVPHQGTRKVMISKNDCGSANAHIFNWRLRGDHGERLSAVLIIAEDAKMKNVIPCG